MADMNNNNGGNQAPTGEDAIRQAVENSRNSDESQDDDDDASDDDDADDDSDDDSSGDDAAGDDDANSDDDGDDSDDSDDDDDDEAESGDKKDPKSGRKFSQFAGDGTDKAYISNLEEGYKNSSAEAIRLKGELETSTGRLDTFMRIIGNNPELATAFNKALGDAGDKGSGGGSGGSDDDSNSKDAGLDNPFIKNMQSEWQEKSEAEIQEFIDANPEVVTDPQIAADVKHYMKLFSNDYYERTGKLMSGGDAMAKAYKHLGLEDKRGKQELANGAKKNLTPPRSRGNKAKKSGGQKPQFTADQIAMAKAMGRDEKWLAANAK
jgi:hypothetical protein